MRAILHPAAWLVVVGWMVPIASARELPVERIRLPEGFRISVYADNVPNARQMALGPGGTLFVGSRGAGRVYAVADRDGDGRAEDVRILADRLNMPSGLAVRAGALYVAEIHRVIRFDRIEQRLDDAPKPVVIATFPSDRHHGWKFLGFGPDGKLYVPVGMPCNVCEPPKPIYGTITRMQPDGSGWEVFARGVRNSVGFDWQPGTETLWFTDNGHDWMGDDWTPDELNRAPQAGLHFGFPHCHGRGVSDPEFGKEIACEQFVPAAVELGPHVAALGMRFYTGTQFPEAYRGRIFIAEHGSWNRSTPLGYRIVTVRVEGETASAEEVFAEGWLEDGSPWGRPADVLVMPDGSLLVADDHAGAIYRITYERTALAEACAPGGEAAAGGSGSNPSCGR
jgi:glucose/arabinose dehydrogenase